MLEVESLNASSLPNLMTQIHTPLIKGDGKKLKLMKCSLSGFITMTLIVAMLIRNS